MKIPLPTERAMGLVTILSGLAIPIGILIGAGKDLGGEGIAVTIFDVVIRVVNPFGIWAFQSLGGVGVGDSLLRLIGSYVIGTGVSALVWGMIDGFFRSRKSPSPDAD